MNFQPGLDLIVTSYKTPDDLQEFLDSVEKFPPSVPYTVIIVNVCPDEADREVAIQWAWKHEALVHNFTENVGYGKACNMAATRSWRGCVAVFNADVVLTKDSLNFCYAAIMQNKSWGVLGPRQVDQRGRFTAAGIFGTDTTPRHRGWMEVDRGQYAEVRDDAVYVAGSAMFLRREVWEELTCCPEYKVFSEGAVGPLLESFLYFEDSWLSMHAKAHGYLNVYLGNTTIQHKWHKAFKVNPSAEKSFPIAKKMFQDACAAHSIVCEC